MQLVVAVFTQCNMFSFLFVVAKHHLPVSVCAAPGSDGNWEAVDAKSPKPDSRYYLNVCHKVIQTGAAAGCPVNASICAVGKSLRKTNE